MRPERRLSSRNGGAARAALEFILAGSDKSREREGSALAVRKAFFLMMWRQSSCASCAVRT
jgi:hypothetical protein